MLNERAAPAGERPALYCQWLWHGLTVLCDGTVTCGLDDPFKLRSYGNVKSASLADIFSRPAIQERRGNLLAGKSCEGCAMHTTAAGNERHLRPSAPYPRRLIIEPSIKCNIRCRNATCDIANDSTFHLRREDFMPWPLFCKLMDEAGPHIRELYFYNYGEPFAHPRALDMLAYAKQVNPKLEITTSTNGILLARAGMAARIVGEGLLDYVCFTIGGCDQESYAGYHKGGSFEKAFQGMARIMEEKHRTGATKPFVHWRYLLFNWNDEDEHIARAFALRDETGVDEMKFMLSWTPAYGRSLRRAPGTPGFAAIAPHVAFQDGYCPEPFGEAGVWQPETCSSLGDFCWTTKKARLLVKSSDHRVVVKLARHEFTTVPWPRVKIRLPWGEADAEVGVNAWHENVFALPEAYSSEDVAIELDVDPIFSPLRHGESDDSRDLGVMVSLDRTAPTPNPFRTAAASLAPIVERTHGEGALT